MRKILRNLATKTIELERWPVKLKNVLVLPMALNYEIDDYEFRLVNCPGGGLIFKRITVFPDNNPEEEGILIKFNFKNWKGEYLQTVHHDSIPDISLHCDYIFEVDNGVWRDYTDYSFLLTLLKKHLWEDDQSKPIAQLITSDITDACHLYSLSGNLVAEIRAVDLEDFMKQLRKCSFDHNILIEKTELSKILFPQEAFLEDVKDTLDYEDVDLIAESFRVLVKTKPKLDFRFGPRKNRDDLEISSGSIDEIFPHEGTSDRSTISTECGNEDTDAVMALGA